MKIKRYESKSSDSYLKMAIKAQAKNLSLSLNLRRFPSGTYFFAFQVDVGNTFVESLLNSAQECYKQEVAQKMEMAIINSDTSQGALILFLGELYQVVSILFTYFLHFTGHLMKYVSDYFLLKKRFASSVDDILMILIIYCSIIFYIFCYQK